MNQKTSQIVVCPEFSLLSNIKHAFFTRKGGISEGIYSSLNLGNGSNDNSDNVEKNREIAMELFGHSSKDLHTLYQIHSNDVIEASGEFKERVEADALVSKTPGTVLGILTADCTPVVFADDENKVIGAAHAGWKGALSGILENTIKKMEELGANKHNIKVAIGPSISQDSYEVGKEFYDRFVMDEPTNAAYFIQSVQPQHYMFSLTSYVEHRLKNAGIDSITNVDMDTYTLEDDFYSYRRSCHKKEPDYGRNLTVIALK